MAVIVVCAVAITSEPPGFPKSSMFLELRCSVSSEELPPLSIRGSSGLFSGTHSGLCQRLGSHLGILSTKINAFLASLVAMSLCGSWGHDFNRPAYECIYFVSGLPWCPPESHSAPSPHSVLSISSCVEQRWLESAEWTVGSAQVLWWSGHLYFDPCHQLSVPSCLLGSHTIFFLLIETLPIIMYI